MITLQLLASILIALTIHCCIMNKKELQECIFQLEEAQLKSHSEAKAPHITTHCTAVVPRERNINKFCGRPNCDSDISIDEWLDEITLVFSARKFSDAEKVDFIYSHLEGQAKAQIARLCWANVGIGKYGWPMVGVGSTMLIQHCPYVNILSLAVGSIASWNQYVGPTLGQCTPVACFNMTEFGWVHYVGPTLAHSNTCTLTHCWLKGVVPTILHLQFVNK